MMGGCHIKPEQFFNLIFGYYDVYNEGFDTTTTTAGDNTYTAAEVPSGEVWIITTLMGLNHTKAGGTIHFGKRANTYNYPVIDTRYNTVTRIAYWSGMLVLKAGERVYIIHGSCDLNDRRRGYILGYKMKLSQ